MYVDSSVIMGMTGDHNGTGFDGISYMRCNPDNDFFPDLDKVGTGGVPAWLLLLWVQPPLAALNVAVAALDVAAACCFRRGRCCCRVKGWRAGSRRAAGTGPA